MLLTIRYFLAIIFVICLISCNWREYPSEKYIISEKYRDLISSFKQGDTLKFQDDEGNLSLYLIPKIDSTLRDKRGHFINAREYKDITIECHELTKTRPGYEDYHLIILHKDPETDSTRFHLRLKDFYSIDRTLPFELQKDTVIANNISFTNYYFFRAYNYTEQKDPNSVSDIYMTNHDGIIAYRCLNGKWWTKAK